MSFTYVGLVPRQLESGRPLVFGDVVDSLSPADELALGEWMASAPAPPVTPPAPQPLPEAVPATPNSEVT